MITVILRVALGSATVAALTAAGLVQPLMHQAGVDPALMVLVIGAGSLAASHVNDAGFWMFKEYFDLDVKQTLKNLDGPRIVDCGGWFDYCLDFEYVYLKETPCLKYETGRFFCLTD